MSTRQTFPKRERLCHRSEIQEVFSKGESVFSHPVKVVFTSFSKTGKEKTCKAAFSASKKRHRRAVARNRVKRRMREAYRKNKAGFYTQLPDSSKTGMMFLYVSDEVLAFADIEKAVMACLAKIKAMVSKS